MFTGCLRNTNNSYLSGLLPVWAFETVWCQPLGIVGIAFVNHANSDSEKAKTLNKMFRMEGLCDVLHCHLRTRHLLRSIGHYERVITTLRKRLEKH